MINPVLLLGVAAAAVYGIYKGLSIKETYENVRVNLASVPQIHRVDLLNGLTLNVSLKVDNPSKDTITLKIPSIKVYYKTKLVASTKISDKTYTINPTATGKISGVKIDAKPLALIGTGIIEDFKKDGVNIIKNVGFDVLLNANGIPLKVQRI